MFCNLCWKIAPVVPAFYNERHWSHILSGRNHIFGTFQAFATFLLPLWYDLMWYSRSTVANYRVFSCHSFLARLIVSVSFLLSPNRDESKEALAVLHNHYTTAQFASKPSDLSWSHSLILYWIWTDICLVFLELEWLFCRGGICNIALKKQQTHENQPLFEVTTNKSYDTSKTIRSRSLSIPSSTDTSPVVL